MTEQPQPPQQPQPPAGQPYQGPYQGPYQPQGQQPPPYAQQPPPPRRLVRPRHDSPLSGVCGGVAQYTGLDATLVRVLAVIAMLVTFPVGPIVYAVMWAVMPKE